MNVPLYKNKICKTSYLMNSKQRLAKYKEKVNDTI